MFFASLTNYIFVAPRGIEFIDGLNNQNDNGFAVMMGVHDGDLYNSPGNFLFTDKPYQNPLETVNVYFLPWKSGRATKVMIADLNASGCDYFTTSEFTGCRFVVTELEIMHVAWSGGGGAWGNQPGAVGTSVLRSQAEREAIGDVGVRQRRRALSISPSSHEGRAANVALESAQSSYSAGPKANGVLPGKMKVFGYKFNNAWRFKSLKYENISKGGKWENFD